MNKPFIILISMIATLISCSDKNSKISFKEDQKVFVKTLETVGKANEKAEQFYNQKSIDGTSLKPDFLSDIEKAISESEGISDNYLDFIHPDLKVQYRDNFIGTYKSLLANLSPNPDMAKAQELDQKLNSFMTFLSTNQKEIDVKMKEVEKMPKKSFWKMVLILLIAEFPAIIIFSFLLLIVLSPFAILGSFLDKMNTFFKSVFFILMALVANPVQIYYWTIWASFCAFTARFYIDSPNVRHPWIYYLVAFLFVCGPIGWLSHKESQTAQTVQDQRRINEGTFLYSLVSIVAFVIFIIWPKIMDLKIFSWVNNIIY